MEIATCLVAYICKTASTSQRRKPLLLQFPNRDGKMTRNAIMIT